MADIPDNRPTFTIVMGCNGSGKAAWKRANRDLLPSLYLDLDSIAEGYGSWDDEQRRVDALEKGNQAVQEALSNKMSYGVESTFSGQRGVNQLNEARSNGYRLLGFYLATSSPDINVERIERRIEQQTGHRVNPDLIPTRWHYSLSNLRKNAELFDELVIYDNSGELDLRYQDPPTMVFIEVGQAHNLIGENERPQWFGDWFKSWQDRQRSVERNRRKERKHHESGSGR